MPTENEFKITIGAPFAGFAPAYWANPYPFLGNKNMAGDMQNVDITDPSKITQGPGLVDLTNGNQVGVVNTLIKHILRTPTANNETFGVGGNKLYKITSSAVVNTSPFPITIDKSGVTDESGESVISDGTYLYVFYNHSGGAGDIGRLTLSNNTWTVNWGSTGPTGAAALQNAPHPSVMGNDGVIYFGNGRYVGWYDPITNTISVDELDLPPGSQVVDVRYHNDRVVILANYPNLGGNNQNFCVIYIWDGLSGSWEDLPNPKVEGRGGALYIKEGAIYVWYETLDGSGTCKLAYLSGNSLTDLKIFKGSLPLFNQVGEYRNMIAWLSGNSLYLFGSTDREIPAGLCQLMSAGYSTAGAFAMPFGTPMFGSTDGGTNFRLARASGHTVNCSWKSLMFDVSPAMIDKVRVHFEPLATGARCDLSIKYNRGLSNKTLLKPGQTGSITFTNDQDKIKKVFEPKLEVDDFRIECDWANGSTTNPVSIKKIEIYGHSLLKD